MAFAYYIRLVHDAVSLFFQEFVIRLRTILDEVPLLHEESHKAISTSLVSSYNYTGDFEENNLIENGNTSVISLVYIWMALAAFLLVISMVKKGVSFIPEESQKSKPNSSGSCVNSSPSLGLSISSSIYYDIPSNLGLYSNGNSPIKSKFFVETYRGKSPVSFLLGSTSTVADGDDEVGEHRPEPLLYL